MKEYILKNAGVQTIMDLADFHCMARKKYLNIFNIIVVCFTEDIQFGKHESE